MKIGDKVRVKNTVDEHPGETGEVVETWNDGGEFDTAVRFPKDGPEESWSFHSTELEEAR